MVLICICFFFNDTATTEIYTLSLHDALPIFLRALAVGEDPCRLEDDLDAQVAPRKRGGVLLVQEAKLDVARADRSEEHTSELQSRQYLVCRLLLEKKKNHKYHAPCASRQH